MLTFSASTVTATAAQRPACPAGKVVAENRQATVIKKGHRLIACVPRQRRAWLVWDWSPPAPRWRLPKLFGRVLAFELRGTRSGTHAIDVVDVVARKTCYSAIAGTGNPPYPSPGDAGELVRDVVVTPTGSLAYIAGPGSGPRDPRVFPDVGPWGGYEVIVVDRDGMRQVDAGLGIDPASLTLDGSTVSWTSSGTIRSSGIGLGSGCTDPLLPGQGRSIRLQRRPR